MTTNKKSQYPPSVVIGKYGVPVRTIRNIPLQKKSHFSKKYHKRSDEQVEIFMTRLFISMRYNSPGSNQPYRPAL